MLTLRIERREMRFLEQVEREGLIDGRDFGEMRVDEISSDSYDDGEK
jgi:hypothetical protein